MALELLVKILGDSGGLEKATDKAGGALKGLGGVSATSMLAVAGVATVAAGAALAISDMTNAAAEDRDEQNKLMTTIKAATGSTADYTDQVNAAIAAGQEKAFTDSDTRAALESLVTATHSVTDATALLSTAQDVARFAGVDLATAADAVAKAQSGQDGALRKLIPGLEKGATATDTIANAQKAAAGQADAYANSTAGQQAKVADSFAEVGETIGSAFLPLVDAIVPAIIPMIKSLGELIAVLVPILVPALTAVGKAFAFVIGFITSIIGWIRDLIYWIGNALGAIGNLIAKLNPLQGFSLPFGLSSLAVPAVAGAPTAATFGARSDAGLAPVSPVTINIYGDPARIRAQVIEALRTYNRRNSVLGITWRDGGTT